MAEVVEVPVEPSCVVSVEELELEVGSPAIFPALHGKRTLKLAACANNEEQGLVDSLCKFCMPSS